MEAMSNAPFPSQLIITKWKTCVHATLITSKKMRNKYYEQLFQLFIIIHLSAVIRAWTRMHV